MAGKDLNVADKEALREEYNRKLKEVRSLNDLQALLKQMNADDIDLYGKRRGYWAFGFCEHPYRDGYIHYLYDDGYSVGNSKPENLWRALKAR